MDLITEILKAWEEADEATRNEVIHFLENAAARRANAEQTADHPLQHPQEAEEVALSQGSYQTRQGCDKY